MRIRLHDLFLRCIIRSFCKCYAVCSVNIENIVLNERMIVTHVGKITSILITCRSDSFVLMRISAHTMHTTVKVFSWWFFSVFSTAQHKIKTKSPKRTINSNGQKDMPRKEKKKIPGTIEWEIFIHVILHSIRTFP